MPNVHETLGSLYDRLSERDDQEGMSMLEELKTNLVDAYDENGKPWKERYQEANNRYKERFFAGNAAEKLSVDITEDLTEEAKTYKFNDMFKRRD